MIITSTESELFVRRDTMRRIAATGTAVKVRDIETGNILVLLQIGLDKELCHKSIIEIFSEN